MIISEIAQNQCPGVDGICVEPIDAGFADLAGLADIQTAGVGACGAKSPDVFDFQHFIMQPF
jgi:hypothetical protein